MKNCQPLLFILVLSTMIMSCSSEEEVIIEELPDPIVIEGNYIGRWASTAASGSVYTGEPISARIRATSDPTQFEGDFFFTAVYTSCCNSGSSDGPITLEVVKNEIIAFEYDDKLPNCNGNFKGSGKVSDKGRITIQFTGADCEGEHTNASLFLTKQ